MKCITHKLKLNINNNNNNNNIDANNNFLNDDGKVVSIVEVG
jgi:hypothetical protein